MGGTRDDERHASIHDSRFTIYDLRFTIYQMEVTRTYLQMESRAELRPAKSDAPALRVDRAMHCPPSFFAYLYREVGRIYQWVDRLEWSDEETSAHLSRPGVTVWIMYYEGSPAGYFELQRHSDGST